MSAESPFAVPSGLYGGLPIVVSQNLPREVIGHHVKQLRAHPLVGWACRLLGKSDHWAWVGSHTPMYGEASAYRMGDMLIVPPDFATRLRAALKDERT